MYEICFAEHDQFTIPALMPESAKPLTRDVFRYVVKANENLEMLKGMVTGPR